MYPDQCSSIQIWSVSGGCWKSGTKNNNNNNDNNNNADFGCSVNLENIFSPNSNNALHQKSCVNDINSKIFRCNTKHQFQLDFYPSENFVSSVTKSIYDCVTLLGTILINWHSLNVIYLITCCRFSLQYVRETLQKLNEMFNFHEKDFRSKRKRREVSPTTLPLQNTVSPFY